MNSLTHVRKGRTIITMEQKDDDGQILVATSSKTYETYNQARKASRKIQMDADGALGLGTLRLQPEKRKQNAGRQLSRKAIRRIRNGR